MGALALTEHELTHESYRKKTRTHLRLMPCASVEYDESNTLLARYTHSGLRTDDVLAVDVTSDGVSAGLAQSAGSFQYIKDAQGTVTDIANNSGQKIQHYVYSAFGVLLGVTDAFGSDITPSPKLNTSYTYTGRERDEESGLYYYRARFYMAEIGRFIQSDPDPGQIENPNTLNTKYSYVQNRPNTFRDPSGKSIGGVLNGIGLFVGGLAISSLLGTVGISAYIITFIIDPMLALGGAAILATVAATLTQAFVVPWSFLITGLPKLRNLLVAKQRNIKTSHYFCPCRDLLTFMRDYGDRL